MATSTRPPWLGRNYPPHTERFLGQCWQRFVLRAFPNSMGSGIVPTVAGMNKELSASLKKYPQFSKLLMGAGNRAAKGKPESEALMAYAIAIGNAWMDHIQQGMKLAANERGCGPASLNALVCALRAEPALAHMLGAD
jgi:hypothetical protein